MCVSLTFTEYLFCAKSWEYKDEIVHKGILPFRRTFSDWFIQSLRALDWGLLGAEDGRTCFLRVCLCFQETQKVSLVFNFRSNSALKSSLNSTIIRALPSQVAVVSHSEGLDIFLDSGEMVR